MVLTTVEEDSAAAEARYLVSRTRQEVSESASRAIHRIDYHNHDVPI